jgi:RNA polymerase sigma-70 factor (sigma-E family)
VPARHADFVAFAHEITPFIHRTARAFLHDEERAKDVTQEVLAKIFVSWKSRFRDTVESPHAYIRQMVVNECVSTWRRTGRREVTVEPGLLPEPEHAPDFTIHAADRDELLTAVRQLTTTQRLVIGLRFFSNLSDPEIAHTMGISEATVRTHSSQAIAALRRRLSGPEVTA